MRSLYQVVEAHGLPLNIGGQPSHLDSFGDSGCWQDDSAEVRLARQEKRETVKIKLGMVIGDRSASYCLPWDTLDTDKNKHVFAVNTG